MSDTSSASMNLKTENYHNRATKYFKKKSRSSSLPPPQHQIPELISAFPVRVSRYRVICSSCHHSRYIPETRTNPDVVELGSKQFKPTFIFIPLVRSSRIHSQYTSYHILHLHTTTMRTSTLFTVVAVFIVSTLASISSPSDLEPRDVSSSLHYVYDRY